MRDVEGFGPVHVDAITDCAGGGCDRKYSSFPSPRQLMTADRVRL
jgi:hypothetical protein